MMLSETVESLNVLQVRSKDAERESIWRTTGNTLQESKHLHSCFPSFREHTNSQSLATHSHCLLFAQHLLHLIHCVMRRGTGLSATAEPADGRPNA